MLRKRIATLIGLSTALIFAMGCGQTSKSENHSGTEQMESTENSLKNLSVAQYDSIISADPLVMVDFHATWCKPCVKMAPFLKKVGADNKGKVTIVKIDIDDNKELAKHFGINQIPNLKTYFNGKKFHDTLGFQNEEALLNILGEYLQ